MEAGGPGARGRVHARQAACQGRDHPQHYAGHSLQGAGSRNGSWALIERTGHPDKQFLGPRGAGRTLQPQGKCGKNTNSPPHGCARTSAKAVAAVVSCLRMGRVAHVRVGGLGARRHQKRALQASKIGRGPARPARAAPSPTDSRDPGLDHARRCLHGPQLRPCPGHPTRRKLRSPRRSSRVEYGQRTARRSTARHRDGICDARYDPGILR